MKASINIATYPPRLESLKKTLASIYEQFDVVRIYFNQYKELPLLKDPQNKIVRVMGENLTDNGKFIGLTMVKEPEYYFTGDDDLIYPSDYRDTTIKAIEKYGCIITYHGRKLQGLNVKYYQSHRQYHCMQTYDSTIPIDVCGTGVTAFSTKYFKPAQLHNHPYHKMSDLVFSLEAAKFNRIIGMHEHKANWIKHTNNEETIYDTEHLTEQTRQIEIANQIYEIRYGN